MNGSCTLWMCNLFLSYGLFERHKTIAVDWVKSKSFGDSRSPPSRKQKLLSAHLCALERNNRRCYTKFIK